jgi:lipid-binding putative hydrolase
MNKIKNNFIKVLFGIFLVTSLNSCDEGGDPSKEEIGMTTTGAYAGDWYVTLTDSDGITLVEHALHSTYNTAANDNTMWIDDHSNGYVVKSKIFMNTATGSFFANDALNINDGGDNDTTVTITGGQITKYGAVSKGGHPVDRIQFRVHYSYDPDGYDIIYDGHKRTGFLEDEY